MKADIGLIGLAVMGENLVLNMESRGYTVAVFNRTTEKVSAFVNGRGKGKTHPRILSRGVHCKPQPAEKSNADGKGRQTG